jgi:hypothetical protein
MGLVGENGKIGAKLKVFALVGSGGRPVQSLAQQVGRGDGLSDPKSASHRRECGVGLPMPTWHRSLPETTPPVAPRAKPSFAGSRARSLRWKPRESAYTYSGECVRAVIAREVCARCALAGCQRIAGVGVAWRTPSRRGSWPCRSCSFDKRPSTRRYSQRFMVRPQLIRANLVATAVNNAR